MITSLLVKGAFTEDDLHELMATFRHIEQRQADLPFMFAILDGDLSMDQAETMIQRTFPRVAGPEPHFHSFTAIQVICPDGQIRSMVPDIENVQLDHDQTHLIMTQGTVKINDMMIRGEAWLIDNQYHFTPLQSCN